MYYKISNTYGIAYLKNEKDSCVIVKLPDCGPVSLTKYDYAYNKQPDDLILKASKIEFATAARKAFSLMI